MAVLNPTSITVFQNAAKGWRWTFKQSDGTPVNLNGFTFEGGYMSKRGKPFLGTFTIDPAQSDLVNGQVVMTLADGWSDEANISISGSERIIEFMFRASDPTNAYINMYGFMTILRSSF